MAITSSIKLTSGPAGEITESVSRMLGGDIGEFEPVDGGRNNKVYIVSGRATDRYIVKVYADIGPEGRDRLESEYTSLELLSRNRVACVPKPIAVDRASKCAVYEYIDGERVSIVSAADIKQAVQFAAVLRNLAGRIESHELPKASDSATSLGELTQGVETRLNRLLAVQENGSVYQSLADFLNNEFIPCHRTAMKSTILEAAKSGTYFGHPLSHEELTLSPSDFGFHNAIKRSNGQIVFLDLEYFGWDDPAKMIADFILHPALEIEHGLKKQFLKDTVALFEDQPGVSNRIPIVYFWCCLKWCLLLLNEFVPQHLKRQRLAVAVPAELQELQLEQLAKARTMLNKIWRWDELSR